MHIIHPSNKHSWGSGNLDRCHQTSDSIRRGFDSRWMHLLRLTPQSYLFSFLLKLIERTENTSLDAKCIGRQVPKERSVLSLCLGNCGWTSAIERIILAQRQTVPCLGSRDHRLLLPYTRDFIDIEGNMASRALNDEEVISEMNKMVRI